MQAEIEWGQKNSAMGCASDSSSNSGSEALFALMPCSLCDAFCTNASYKVFCVVQRKYIENSNSKNTCHLGHEGR